MKNIAKGDAQVLEVAMSTFFTEYFAGHSWEKKIVGIGTDGESIMLGKNNGFVVKLRQRLDRPELVAVHCSAHRNELAYKDAARGIQLYKKVDALLLSLYFIYRNSPLNRSNLKEAFDALGETLRIPSRVDGTRWVPHISRAVSNVLKGYKGFVTLEGNRAARKSKELLRTATFQGCCVLPPLPLLPLPPLPPHLDRSSRPLRWMFPKWNQSGPSSRVIPHAVKKLSWEEVNLSFETQCPNVLGLIDLILTLPAFSADAERGFSHM